VAVLDSKWQVPDSYDINERELVMPPPRGYTGTAPMLGVLSVRAIEDQATGEGALALFAWQVLAGGFAAAEQTLDRLVNRMEIQGLELLMLGHAHVATGIGGGAAFEIAQRARKILKQPVTPQSIDASLLLGVTALPFGAERVRTLLEMLGPELQHGTDEHRAIHALVRAAADQDPARIDEAHELLSVLDDHFALAQLALILYTRELAAEKRPEALRGLLDHAIYRYEADGRPEWAARTIVHALVPQMTDTAEITDALGRAAAFATQARSQHAIDSVFRAASKLGYTGTVATLSQLDPPTFAKRDGAAPAAAPPPAEAAAPKAEGKKKAPARKGGKKKAS
jgi:hypothetical protein